MSRRMQALLRREYSPALLLALAAVFAYGLLVARTGFYWDDLPMSWIRYELGPRAMAEYFSTNRPVWGWLYQVTTRLLPQVPIYWQIFALLWRWVTAALVWLVSRSIWPQRKGFAVAVGLLFLVYPGFNAQWTAFLYSHFFIVLAFFLFSLLSMLLSMQRRAWTWTVLGLLFAAFSLWMMEYFFVLELARPAIIWVALPGPFPGWRARISQTLRVWWPYLVVFLAAVLSRLFVFNNQVYGLGLLPRLRSDFFGTSAGLIKNALVSFWTVTVAAWMQAFQLPDSAIHGPRTILLYLVVILVVLVSVVAWFWLRLERDADPAAHRGLWSPIVLGLIMLPFASAPFWLIDLPVTLAFPANRFTLPSMLAVSLILAGLLEWLRWSRARYVLLALLVSLAAGRQFLWGTDFARDWEVQKGLFWQMTWRAPGLKPQTMVLMNEGALHFYADNSLSAALNWVYAPGLHASGQVPYLLFYPTNRLEGALPTLEPGLDVTYDYLAGKFVGSTSQVVSFYFLPPACLRLLDPVIDAGNHFIPDQYMMREGAVLSSSQWITSDATARLPHVYGPEPQHGWCYYFERADLARQMQQWDKAASLGDRAFALGDYPNDPSERFVYVEAYAHVGDWAKAFKYSTDSHRVSPAYVDPMLCKLWARIDVATPASPAKAQALQQVKTKFGCSGE